MKHEDLDFETFFRQLTYPRAFASDDRRRRFIETFRNELVVLLLGLRRGGITGQTPEPLEVPERCDLCSAGFSPDTIYVDGVTTRDGAWAYMCIGCFSRTGKGIGWGIGQLYAHNGDGWQCIGGGDPEPTGAAA